MHSLVFFFGGGVILQSQVKHYEIAVHLNKMAILCPFFLNRLLPFHWEAFGEYVLKNFLTESDYGVGSEKAGDLSLSNLASSPAIAPWHMECPKSIGKGQTDSTKGHTVSKDLQSIHCLHNLASLLKLFIIFLKVLLEYASFFLSE